MDFCILSEAMASKSYDKIADICDDLMLQVATQAIAFHDEWPYAIHPLGHHIYVDDINSARFLWKSIPSLIKESQPEAVAAWKVGQRFWMRDYLCRRARGHSWVQLESRSCGLILRTLHQEDV